MADLRVPALIHMAMAGLLASGFAIWVGASFPNPVLGVGVGATILAATGAMVEVWRRDRDSQRAAVVAVLQLSAPPPWPLEDSRWPAAQRLLDRIAADSPGLADRVRDSLEGELRAIRRLEDLSEAERSLELGELGLSGVLEARQQRVRELLDSLRALALQLELHDACAPMPAREAMADAVAQRSALDEVDHQVTLRGLQQRAQRAALRA